MPLFLLLLICETRVLSRGRSKKPKLQVWDSVSSSGSNPLTDLVTNLLSTSTRHLQALEIRGTSLLLHANRFILGAKHSAETVCMPQREDEEGNGTPLQYSCLENPMDGGAWWAAVHVVTKSRTRLSDFTFTFHFHALEKEMATHSSILAWRIPGTGEPVGLPSMGSHRVRHDW